MKIINILPCLYGCLLLLLGSACEEKLDLSIEDYEPKLVVDGSIEEGQFPVVVLTKSAAYFSTVDSTALRELVMSRAKVSVTDGETEEVLTLRRNENYFPPYIYQGTELRGEAGKTYYLTVELEGKKYEATTTIPPAVQLDSLWFVPSPDKEDRGLLYGRFQDKAETEDYYRVFTQRPESDELFIPVYLSAMGDQYFNGESFTFSILRGAESLSDVQDDIYFSSGELVLVKVCTIDRAHFDFWRTLERELYVTGNPFSSSGNEVLSNISGGALGVWGGYNSTIYSIRIP